MLQTIKGGLIVSCQALEDEPLHGSDFMAKMALAAKEGGAVGIRANSVADIQAIKRETQLPVIGIIKSVYDDSEIFITPTKKEVLELLHSDCDMVALDATLRKRPNNEKLEDLVKLIHDHGKLAMADISTFEEAMNAESIGFDCISTTLSGYTPYSPQISGPDFKLLKQTVKHLTIPVIAEGRYWTVEEAKKAIKIGAYALVIGTSITRPHIITKRFVEGIRNYSSR